MQELSPINYRINLEPDLVNFKFEGKCEILLEASEPVAEVRLNILEIAIWSCRVLRSNEFVDRPFMVDHTKEEVQHLPIFLFCIRSFQIEI